MTACRMTPVAVMSAAILFAGVAASPGGDALAQAYYPDHGPPAPTAPPPMPPPTIVLPPTVPVFEAPPVEVMSTPPVGIVTGTPALDAFRGRAVVIADDETIGVNRAPELVPLGGQDSGLYGDNSGRSHYSEWERDAYNMFPDSDCPTCDYQAYWDGVRAEQDRYLREDAIPEGLQGLIGVPRVDYYNGKYRVEIGGSGGITLYLSSRDTTELASAIDGKMGEIRQIAAERATRLRELIEQTYERVDYAESQDNKVWAERLRAEAKDYESRLEGYTGYFLEPEAAPAGAGAGGDGAPVAGDAGPGDAAADGPAAAGSDSDGPVPVADDVATAETDGTLEADIVPDPSFDEPSTIDAMLAGDEPLIERFTLGDLAGDNGDIILPMDDIPAFAADDISVIDFSQLWSDDIGGGEVREGLDFTVRGDIFAELSRPLVDAGLAVTGTLVPVAGLAIAGTTNFKKTYDYAIEKGLDVHQAIFAATVAGTVGAGDAYVMDKGVGKVAGWTGKLLRWGGTKAGSETLTAVKDQVVGDVMGTAGNAAGVSITGDVGKRLVDGMAANAWQKSYYEQRAAEETLRRQEPGYVDHVKVGTGTTGGPGVMPSVFGGQELQR